MTRIPPPPPDRDRLDAAVAARVEASRLAKAAATIKDAPALELRLPLEGLPEIVLRSETRYDLERLRGWLLAADTVEQIVQSVKAYLDRLEGEAA